MLQPDVTPSRAAVRPPFLALMVGVGLLGACHSIFYTSSAPPRPAQPASTFTLPGGAPASFVQSTSDVRSTTIMPVREGLTKQAEFRAATEVLSQKFTVDVSDPRAGFLMTPWQASLLRNGVPDLRYRTRVVVRFLGDEWKEVSIRAEANWQRGDEWAVGYDSTMLRVVSEDLAGKIGRIDTKKPAP
ncbi:MAG TPA: hypothetical protein VJU87_03775 [Gemmatimonadaceae bacterium]|nr:hypothetical protein [Gemmatimonadaceae bacterium]